ncbi:MAG: CPXCG motif-containing cysteine-rich protein [Acidobacteriota bacterium]
MQTMISCPYCGETNTVLVDPTGGSTQRYVEDCQVCCQPWEVMVTVDEEGDVSVEARTADE